MQHEIDLGDELKITVKYAGQAYAVREPTVGEIDWFREQKDVEGSAVVVAFLSKLGMPAEVVKAMGMSKAKQLIDGLMDMLVKKN